MKLVHELTVLVPETAPPTLMHRLGPGVRVERWFAGASLGDTARAARFVVPPFLDRTALEELFGQLPDLQVLQVLSAGVDWIIEAVPPGVVLCSAKGVHDVAVAEWVVAATLYDLKRLDAAARAMTRPTWVDLGPLGTLESSTVLVLGYGSIGVALESMLRPFGAKILRVARRRRDGVSTVDDLADLLPVADVLVDLLPLTPETHGLVDGPLLGLLKKGALVVNAGRGATIDAAALLAELHAGRLRAVLDVTDPEPLGPEHPMWRARNLLVTHHSAGNTTLLADKAWTMVVEQVRRFRNGEGLLGVVAADGY